MRIKSLNLFRSRKSFIFIFQLRCISSNILITIQFNYKCTIIRMNKHSQYYREKCCHLCSFQSFKKACQFQIISNTINICCIETFLFSCYDREHTISQHNSACCLRRDHIFIINLHQFESERMKRMDSFFSLVLSQIS